MKRPPTARDVILRFAKTALHDDERPEIAAELFRALDRCLPARRFDPKVEQLAQHIRRHRPEQFAETLQELKSFIESRAQSLSGEARASCLSDEELMRRITEASPERYER